MIKQPETSNDFKQIAQINKIEHANKGFLPECSLRFVKKITFLSYT